MPVARHPYRDPIFARTRFRHRLLGLAIPGASLKPA